MHPSVTAVCRSFDPQMGTTGRVLWAAAPDLLHVGAVVFTAACMVGVMGNTLFGFRAQALSSLACRSSLERVDPVRFVESPCSSHQGAGAWHTWTQ